MIHKTNLRALLPWGVFVLIFTVIVGCAARKPFWGDPETGFILTYRMTPNQVWTYHTTTKQNTSMEMMGQSMDTETDIMLNYTVTGTGLDDQKNLLATVTMDTMSMTSKSMRGENTFDLTPIIGKSFGLTFSPKGKEIAFSGIDTLQIDLGQMVGGKQSVRSLFRDFFPDLPQNPIKVRETWTSKEEQVQPQGGMEITVSTEATHTLQGFENVDGLECLKIETKAKGTLDGSGEQMGAEVAFEGDLEVSSTWYFAYKKGIFVKATSEHFVEGTVAVSGQTQMTMPLTQETKVEVKLVP